MSHGAGDRVQFGHRAPSVREDIVMDELEVGRAVGRLMAENDKLAAEVARLRERVAQQERVTERALAANVELRARDAAFEAVARRLLAAHDPGYVSLMQEDADELRRLLGERA